MTLVAPGIEVNWREENSIRAMNDSGKFRQVLRKPKARRKILFLRIQQSLRISILSTDERFWRAVHECQVAVRVANVHQRVHEFIAQTKLDRGVPRQLKCILREPVRRPLPQLHLRDSSLHLLHRGQSKQETGKTGTRPVVRRSLCCKSIRKLIVAAILEKSPHRPYVPPVASAEFQPMTPPLPAQDITAFNDRVPGFHRRGGVSVAHTGISLHVKPWRSPRPWTAKSNTLNPKLGHDIVRVCAFRGVAHCQSRNTECRHIHHSRAYNSVPRDVSLLREIIVIRSESRQVDGHESVFAAQRIPCIDRVAVCKYVIHTRRPLVRAVHFVTCVDVVVAISTGANHAGLAHHRAATRHRASHVHVHARLGHVLLHKKLGCGVDPALRNLIVGKRIAENLWIAGTDCFRRIEIRIRVRRRGIVDRFAAHAEVAENFVSSWHRVRHRVGFRVAQSLIVHKEKCFPTSKRAAQRAAVVVLYEMLRHSHVAERVRIERTIPQEFISRSVNLIAARFQHYADHARRRAAKLGGIAVRHHLELLHCVH